MKRYYIKRYGFSNHYSLYWANKDSIEEQTLINAGYERITRKQAIKECIEENFRRKYDPGFAYYAANKILPYGYEQTYFYDTNTYIIEKYDCSKIPEECLKVGLYW